MITLTNNWADSIVPIKEERIRGRCGERTVRSKQWVQDPQFLTTAFVRYTHSREIQTSLRSEIRNSVGRYKKLARTLGITQPIQVKVEFGKDSADLISLEKADLFDGTTLKLRPIHLVPHFMCRQVRYAEAVAHHSYHYSLLTPTRRQNQEKAKIKATTAELNSFISCLDETQTSFMVGISIHRFQNQTSTIYRMRSALSVSFYAVLFFSSSILGPITATGIEVTGRKLDRKAASNQDRIIQRNTQARNAIRYLENRQKAEDVRKQVLSQDDSFNRSIQAQFQDAVLYTLLPIASCYVTGNQLGIASVLQDDSIIGQLYSAEPPIAQRLQAARDNLAWVLAEDVPLS